MYWHSIFNLLLSVSFISVTVLYCISRLDEALNELFTTAKEDELFGIPVLILANKQDLSDALKPVDIASKLHEEKCMRMRRWNIFGVCANDPKYGGLHEAFEWLVDEMAAAEKNRLASNMIYGSGASEQNNNTAKSNADTKKKETKPFFSSFVESLKSLMK